MEHQANRYVGARTVARSLTAAGSGGSAVGLHLVTQVCSIVLFASLTVPGHAQVMGEEAELDRLRAKAEEAMGNDDAEGAAMSMGRAALMAAQLAKRQAEPAPRQLWKATEHLYRSQEHGYRAVALFRRAGGELPASAGVCGSLQLAQLELQHAQSALDRPDHAPQKEAAPPRLKTVRQTMEDWVIVLGSMQTEFRCPPSPAG